MEHTLTRVVKVRPARRRVPRTRPSPPRRVRSCSSHIGVDGHASVRAETPCETVPRAATPRRLSSPVSPRLYHRSPSPDTVLVLTPILKPVPTPLRAPRNRVVSRVGSPENMPTVDDGVHRAVVWRRGDEDAQQHGAERGEAERPAGHPAGSDVSINTLGSMHSAHGRLICPLHHTFASLLYATIGPAYVAPYLCLQDILELSLTCRAAQHGLMASASMWRALVRERFGVCVANVEGCFSEALHRRLVTAPRTYDSQSVVAAERHRPTPATLPATGGDTGRPTCDGIVPAARASAPVQAPLLHNTAPVNTPSAEGAGALRQGTVVMASTHTANPASSSHPLPRLTLHSDTPGHRGAAKLPCAVTLAHDPPLTNSTSPVSPPLPFTHPLSGMLPCPAPTAVPAVPNRFLSLFWRRLFQWLQHHRVQQFLTEHIDDRLRTASLVTARDSREAVRRELTRAIHVLYQGGCAHTEHACRLAALLERRASWLLAEGYPPSRGGAPPPWRHSLPDGDELDAMIFHDAAALRRAREDLALAAVLNPDSDAAATCLNALMRRAHNDKDGWWQPPQNSDDECAAGLVARWVHGYNAASAACNAHNPFALFSFLQGCLFELGEGGGPAAAVCQAADSTSDTMRRAHAQLYVANAVLLFFHTYETLQTAPTHVLVKASKALPQCGVVARLLLQSLSDWLHMPEETALGAGSRLSGWVELAVDVAPVDVQRRLDAQCERWVSQWVLRRQVTLPEMVEALQQGTAHTSSPCGEQRLCELLLSLHYRVLLLPQPHTTMPNTRRAVKPTRTSHISATSACVARGPGSTSHHDAPTFVADVCGFANRPWSTWDCTLRYLLLTPLHSAKAAALTHMSTLYHSPLKTHTREPAEVPARVAHTTELLDDAAPLPDDTDGTLVAMRLLHVACALDPLHAPAHSTLAALCLSVNDVDEAQRILALYLERWARVPVAASPHTRDSVIDRPAGHAERDPGLCLVPAHVLELLGRCEGRHAALRACKRWASEAVRQHPRLSAPVRLRAATYMDRGLGARAGDELAALLRVTMRADDVALRLRFLLDVLQRGESVETSTTGTCSASRAPWLSAQWELVAELTGTLYGLAAAENQLGQPPHSAAPTSPYNELLVHARRAYHRYASRGGHARIGECEDAEVTDEDVGEACAETFLHMLLHGSEVE